MISGVSPGWLRARESLERLRAAALFDERTCAARIIDVTPEEYLADPCRTPSLSASTAHTIVSRSPLHAWTEHPRLGGSPNGSGGGTKAMNEGHLLHQLLLGKGKGIVVIDAHDFKTNAAREARDAAIADGQVPIIQHKFAQVSAVAAKLRDKIAALGFALDGKSEVPIEWVDECSEGPVLCRSMLDHCWLEDGRAIDIKKVENANPRQIARIFVEYGYDIQYAAYTRAIARLRPEFAGRVDFTFLFCEIEPPYSVVPVRLDGALREIGGVRWEAAVRIWRECMTANNFPDYSNGEPITIEAPPWVITQELGTWQA